MTIPKFTEGQALTVARLNAIVLAALQNVAGADGIQVTRSAGGIVIGLAKRDRGVPLGAKWKANP